MTSGIFADARGRALFEAARALVTELDLEAVLERFLAAACDFTLARYAAIGILDRERRGLERFITSGLDDEARRAIGDLPRGRGILGALIVDPQPMRLEHVGQHPRSYGFPPGHPPMETFLGVPIVIRGEPWGNLYLTDKQGGEPFSDDDEEAAVLLAEWASIAVDNARNFEASEQQRTALAQAVRALEATTDIALAVGGETDLARVLELITKRGRALVDARALLINLVDGEDLVVAAGAGELPEGMIGARMPIAGSTSEEVLRTRRPVREGNVDASARWRPTIVVDGAKTSLIVPLMFRGRALGVLNAFDSLRASEAFTADDERLLNAFAATAATAVAGAQTVAGDRVRAMLAAEERERARWARELHDDTLQELAVFSMSLQSALSSADDGAMRQTVEAAIDQAQRQVRSLRGIITDLRPADLDELGVAAALEALAERYGEAHQLQVQLEVDMRGDRGAAAERLDPTIEAALYRLVQESLTNVAKHAGATRARVKVEADDHHVEVAISDDGRGFDPRARTDGFGLHGMRERVELTGGKIDIESEPGAGTVVHAVLPALRRDGTLRQAAGA